MYAVVGCRACGALWVLSDPGDSETAGCPRCRKRHRIDRLRRFYESEDREAAREARAAMLADRADASEAFAETPSVAELEGRTDETAVSDREYLERSGIDADEVDAAGEGRERTTRSRPEIVRDAIRRGDSPTESDVVEYATDHGVPPDAARDLLDRLVRRGDVSESRGTYRLL